jgi:FlaA1/EpsC-like NDP-sugar epimerase
MAASAVALALPKQRVARTALLGMSLAASDTLAVAASLGAAAFARALWGGDFDVSDHVMLCAAPVLFVAAYWTMGLYPGIMRNPVTELRRLTLATTFVHLALGAALFLTREGRDYSRIVFVVSWVLAVTAVPVARAAARAMLGRHKWWGAPAVIFGSGPVARDAYERLAANPGMGLRPVAVFSDAAEDDETGVPVPVFHDLRWSPLYASLLNVRRVVLATRGAASAEVLRFLETHAHNFSHVYMMPDLDGVASFGVETGDVGGHMTLELRRDLVRPSCQAGKRALADWAGGDAADWLDCAGGALGFDRHGVLRPHADWPARPPV